MIDLFLYTYTYICIYNFFIYNLHIYSTLSFFDNLLFDNSQSFSSPFQLLPGALMVPLLSSYLLSFTIFKTC